MRNFLLVLLLSLAFGACCTKEDCAQPMVVGMILRNFSAADADSITIVTYQRGSAFTQMADSEFTASVPSYLSDSSRMLQSKRAFRTELDYRIRFLSTGDEFRISDFQLGQQTCNRCLLTGSETTYTYMNGYTLNGEFVSGSGITLTR